MAGGRRVLAVRPPPGADELVADLLWGAGASAVAEVAAGPEGPELVADVPEAASAGVAERLAELGAAVRTLEPRASWADGWRRHARAEVSGRVVVRPDWLAPADAGDPDRVEVVVAAADAFGSGAHPTTRGCLLALQRWLAAGDRVLDVGSGSGVLGAAALLIGAGAVVAVDTDPVARAATAATAAANGVAARLAVAPGGLADLPASERRADLVVANVLLPVVVELAPLLVAAVGAGGRLVVGGVLDDQADAALASLAAAPAPSGVPPLEVVERSSLDGWATLVLARRPPVL